MNRGKTATILDEDYTEEIEEYLDQREIEREEYELLNSFRKFVGYEEVLYSDQQIRDQVRWRI